MKKKIAIAILIIIAFIAVISVYIFLNWPVKSISEVEKEAAIAKILGRKPNLMGKNVPIGDVEFKSKYISFMYPAAATERKQLLNGEELPYTGLELFIFVLENPKLTANAEVINAPQNITSINDYPGVKLRQIQSNIYNQTDVFVGNTRGLAFNKQTNSGYEKTGFFFLNNKIYSFSVQSPDSKAAEELFSKVISSLKFL